MLSPDSNYKQSLRLIGQHKQSGSLRQQADCTNRNIYSKDKNVNVKFKSPKQLKYFEYEEEIYLECNDRITVS